MYKNLLFSMLIGIFFLFSNHQAKAFVEVLPAYSTVASGTLSLESPKKEKRKAKKQAMQENARKLTQQLDQYIAETEPTLLNRKERKQLSKVEKKQEREKKRKVKAAKFLRKITKRMAEGKVIAAIIIAFFLGGLGIHRVVMGGSPWLILGYFILFFGIFGIMPLIDFIRLIIKPSHYEGNDKLFAPFMG